MNPWFLLTFAVVSEVAGIYFQKLSNGHERMIPTIIMAACYMLAIWSLGLVMKQVDVGIAYAVWAGAGTALAAIMGIVIFSESINLTKISGVVLVVIGVVLLNWSSKLHP